MKAILEKVPSVQKQSYYCGHYQKAYFNTPWHYHPQWELTYIKKGNGVCYIGNSIKHFAAGDIILLGNNLPHSWRSEISADGCQVESVFIQWNEDILGDNWLEKPEFSQIKQLLLKSEHGLIFDQQMTDEIKSGLLLLHSQDHLLNLFNFILLLQKLADIPCKALTNAESFQINHRMNTRIEAIIKFVEDNYMNKITADDLSKVTHMTTSSFSSFFRRVFNKTFSDYLNELRVNKACGLLVQSEESIENIAFDCGYNNLAFFHRQFKQLVGVTPLSYRKSFLAFI